MQVVDGGELDGRDEGFRRVLKCSADIRKRYVAVGGTRACGQCFDSSSHEGSVEDRADSYYGKRGRQRGNRVPKRHRSEKKEK